MKRRVADLAAVVPAAIAAILIAGWIVVPRDGPLALPVILAPHLAIAGLAVAPLLLVPGSNRLRVAWLVLLVVAIGRFGGEWLSLPAASAERPLVVASWNMEVGDVDPAETIAALHELEVDVIGLQELNPDQAEAIAADSILANRYPHMATAPAEGVAGLGLLSRFPLKDAVAEIGPARIRARILFDGRPLTAILAHPFPARIATFGPERIPVGFDPSDRDAAIEQLRADVDDVLEAGESLLLIGDFNSAPTEVAYAELTRGLQDAHVEVGAGPGWSWRPSRFEHLPIGLLRIDLIAVSPDLRPVDASVDCSLPGDHCLVQSTIDLAVPLRPIATDAARPVTTGLVP